METRVSVQAGGHGERTPTAPQLCTSLGLDKEPGAAKDMSGMSPERHPPMSSMAKCYCGRGHVGEKTECGGQVLEVTGTLRISVDG